MLVKAFREQPISAILFSRQKNSLGSLKRVALLQLLPSLDAAGLDANHLLPPILGLKVRHARGLVCPGVPHNHVVEVVSHEAEARAATLGHDDGGCRPLRGGVDAVRLACKGNVSGLRLDATAAAADFVIVRGAVESANLDRRNVL